MNSQGNEIYTELFSVRLVLLRTPTLRLGSVFGICIAIFRACGTEYLGIFSLDQWLLHVGHIGRYSQSTYNFSIRAKHLLATASPFVASYM